MKTPLILATLLCLTGSLFAQDPFAADSKDKPAPPQINPVKPFPPGHNPARNRSKQPRAAKDPNFDKLLKALPPRDPAAGKPAPQSKEQKAMEERLRATIVPQLELQNVSLGDALEFLHRTSATTENKEPVNFVMIGVENADNITLSISVKNIPLYECIRYITEIAGVEFRIDGYAVAIGNLHQKTQPPAKKISPF